MTTIKIHGILAREYGNEFQAIIDRPADAWDAIDVNRDGFINRMLDLARDGVYYGVVVDDEHLDYNSMVARRDLSEVHLVPLIMGAGFVGIIATAFSTIFKGVSAAAGIFGGLGGFFGSFALTAASLFISSLLQPTPKLPQPKSPVAGAKESFLFSNKVNVAKQGIPVPVGYGRLRVGSAVIQSTIKSFPQTKDLIDTFAVAVGGGTEDYYVTSDNVHNLYTNTNQPIWGTPIYGEITLRSEAQNLDTGLIGLGPPQRTAIDAFVGKGLAEGWWDKIKHMYTFVWGNSGASAIDWVNIDSNRETWSGNVDTGNLGYISGGGATDFTDCFNTSYTLSGLWDEGMDQDNCFMALAISDQSNETGRPLADAKSIAGIYDKRLNPPVPVPPYGDRTTGVFAFTQNYASNGITFASKVRLDTAPLGQVSITPSFRFNSGVLLGNTTGSDMSILVNTGANISSSYGAVANYDSWNLIPSGELTVGGGAAHWGISGSHSAFAVGTALTPQQVTGLSIALYDLCADLGVPNFT